MNVWLLIFHAVVDGMALATSAQKVLKDLTAKKDIIVKANMGGIVVDQLKQQKAAAESFAKVSFSRCFSVLEIVNCCD
jgi:hypothetical protein